jgi:SAM-dependent methyltransferase
MKKKTIISLDKLNECFYQKHAQSFDQTRQYFWPGWDKLQSQIIKLACKNKKFAVLDVGCGNARFAEFLKKNQYCFTYLGTDNNPYLLKKAEERLASLKLTFQLQRFNLVTALLENKLNTKFNKKFDLIIAFGVLHHIPSFKLRKKLIEQLGDLLKNKNSLLVVTAWQFADQFRFDSKKINFSQFKINQEDLEKNDFILDWQKNQSIPRYCHFVDINETNQINKKINSVKLSSTFFADGKTNNLNLYSIWKRLNDK